MFSPAEPESYAVISSTTMWARMAATGIPIAVGLAVLIWFCLSAQKKLEVALIIPCGAVGLVMLLIVMHQRRSDPPRINLISLLPSIIMLVAYYSLVSHVYLSKGDWTISHASKGFSQALKWHDDIVANTFFIVILFNWLGLPVLVIGSLIQRRLRGLHPELAVYGISMTIAAGLLLLAPSEFRNWFMD